MVLNRSYYDMLGEGVGGKGLNLLILDHYASQLGYNVAPFVIIPTYSDPHEVNLELLCQNLAFPIIARSSAPAEDGADRSYAGIFESINDIESHAQLKKAVLRVRDSATSQKARSYAARHGLELDGRMAVIVQNQISFAFSGVCFSYKDGTNIEYVMGNCGELMDGAGQGQIVMFDDIKGAIIRHDIDIDIPDELGEVAKISRRLKDLLGFDVDMEFGIDYKGKIYVNQVRPVVAQSWPDVKIPADLSDRSGLVKADYVRGACQFEGPAYVMEDLLKCEGLKEFDRGHPDGFVLLTNSLRYHGRVLDLGLEHMKAFVSFDSVSGYSHPISIVVETGACYLGVSDKSLGLFGIETGQNVGVIADQRRGYLYHP